jgi:hypothetical protein
MSYKPFRRAQGLFPERLSNLFQQKHTLKFVCKPMATIPIVNHWQRAVLSAAIIFSIVSTAAVILCLLARRISARALNPSAYCAMISAVLVIFLEAISISAVVHGGLAYRHASDIVAQFGSGPVVLLLKLVIALRFLWVLSLGFSKTSMLLLYAKVFNAERYVEISAGITIAINLLWVTGTILAGCLICRPVSTNWKPVPGGHCGDQVLSFIIIETINLATNALIIVLPLPTLFKLRMGIPMKLVLVAIFSLGFMYVRTFEAV